MVTNAKVLYLLSLVCHFYFDNLNILRSLLKKTHAMEKQIWASTRNLCE